MRRLWDEMTDDEDPVLECRDVQKHFTRGGGIKALLPGGKTQHVQAVDDVSFTLHSNESIGVIGESGCGKTTLLMTLMGLYETTSGEILLNGKPISEFSKGEMKEFRRRVQIIFQDPYNALNPRMSIRSALKEPLKIHGLDRQDERVREILSRVELQPAEKYLDRRPKQLSGGELQRISIARALILEPDVILADEPTSMLDVSTQAAILRLLSDLTEESGVSMVYISHDLSTVSYVCDSINVMYLGRIVESAPTSRIISEPKHPYTQELMQAVPTPDPNAGRERTSMEGAPRDPIDLGEGCRFRDRCPERMDICDVTPEFVSVTDEEGQRRVACHLYYDHQERSDDLNVGTTQE